MHAFSFSAGSCRGVFVASVILVSGAYAQASAQTHAQAHTGTPKTPRACLDAAKQIRAKAYETAQTTHTKMAWKEVEAKTMAQADACGKQFDVATIPMAQLMDLAELRAQSGHLEGADSAFARIAHDPSLTDSARVELFLQAEDVYGNAQGDSTTRERSGISVTRLARAADSLHVSPLQHLRVRTMLINWAQLEENVPDLASVARSVLDLAHTLPPDTQRTTMVKRAVGEAAATLASDYGNDLHADSALMVLHEALASPALAGDTSSFYAARLIESERRFEMVGKPAPALHPDFVVNGTLPAFTGKPTLIMFTAHWCHPCHMSYPAIVAMTHDYGPKGLQSVVVVDLEGSFDGKEMTREQEVEANRHYYVDGQKFISPLVLQYPLRIANMGKPRPMDHDNMDIYNTPGIPVYVVVDAQGIVRASLDGWDSVGHNERMLRQAIERVLPAQASSAQTSSTR